MDKIAIMISGRRRKDQTQAAFYHEFEEIHVDLMRQARCERFLNCYTQNKVFDAPAEEPVLWTLLDKQVDSQASLIFDNMQAVDAFFNDEAYQRFIKPHEFTDPDYMTFEMVKTKWLKQQPVNDDGIKVIYYLKAQPQLSREQFHQIIDEVYSQEMIIPNQASLTRHLRSYCIPLNPQHFSGTAFERAKISQYGIIEEMWFDNREKLHAFHNSIPEKTYQKLSGSIDFQNSFALLMNERVVFGKRAGYLDL